MNSGKPAPLRDTQGQIVQGADDGHRRPGQKPQLKPAAQHPPGFIPATKFKLQKFGRRVKAAVHKVLKKVRRAADKHIYYISLDRCSRSFMILKSRK